MGSVASIGHLKDLMEVMAKFLRLMKAMFTVLFFRHCHPLDARNIDHFLRVCVPVSRSQLFFDPLYWDHFSCLVQLFFRISFWAYNLQVLYMALQLISYIILFCLIFLFIYNPQNPRSKLLEICHAWKNPNFKWKI